MKIKITSVQDKFSNRRKNKIKQFIKSLFEYGTEIFEERSDKYPAEIGAISFEITKKTKWVLFTLTCKYIAYLEKVPFEYQPGLQSYLFNNLHVALVNEASDVYYSSKKINEYRR